MESLKIRSHINPILDLIRDNDLTTVVAPTGTGKSLGIPLGVGESGSKIFVSVPTIVSAISLSETLKRLNPELKIGYAAEGNIEYTSETQVVYATSGHLRLKILRDAQDGKCNFDFADVLMIDEYHLRKADNDVIFGLWKHCLGEIKSSKDEQERSVPRMVLVSATPDPELQKISAKYVVEIESYPITVRYSDSRDTNKDIIEMIKKMNLSTDPGHILVFVAGVSDVEFVSRGIQIPPKSKVYRAYGQMNKDELQQIYETVPPGIRKIIVATNVLETSVTVPDVGIVIDSMLEKQAGKSPIGGLSLNTTSISTSAAIQRCGRTGRTQAGVCIRMISLEKYNKLDQHTPPEIERVPIHRYVMELITTGFNPEEILPQSVEEEINNSIGLLKRLNIVSEENQITEGGKFIFNFPLGVRTGAMLYQWVSQTSSITDVPVYPGAVIISILDNWGPSYFVYPRQRRETDVEYADKLDTFNTNMEQFHSKYGSVGMLVKMWNTLVRYRPN